MPTYFQPGVASSKKMEVLMEKCIRMTLRRNRLNLDQFLDISGRLEGLVWMWHDFDLHNQSIATSAGIKVSSSKAGEAIRLAIRHDTSFLVFFDLWRELGQALRNLMAANYESVFRSLRWMIEASVFWADMQLDDWSAPKHAKWFYDQRAKINDVEYQRMFSEIYSVSSARFEERLLFKEKFKRLTLGEILNGLRFTGSAYPKGADPVTVKKNLKELYSVLSDYSHLTLETVHEIHYEYLHGDFAFYQDYAFDESMFEDAIGVAWRTLDSVVTLLILVESQFLGYESPQEFVSALGDVRVLPPLRKSSVKQRLPMISLTLGR